MPTTESLMNGGPVRTTSLGRQGNCPVKDLLESRVDVLTVEDIVDIQRRLLEQIAGDHKKGFHEREEGVTKTTIGAFRDNAKAIADSASNFAAAVPLQDEEFIRDQQRILEQIQQEFQAQRNTRGMPAPGFSVPNLVNDAEVSCSPAAATPPGCAGLERVVSIEGTFRPLTRDWDTRTSAEGGMVPGRRDTLTAINSSVESPVHFVPKIKNIRLKGTRHVYRAIENGTSTLVLCFNCRTALQVPQTCTAVYCSVCQQVTPMDLALATAASASYGASSTLQDSQLAEALQRQELDAALARVGTARSHRPRPSRRPT